jgi:hypothetical protein
MKLLVLNNGVELIMKLLISITIILVIFSIGLYILNFNKNISNKDNWPAELNRIPNIGEIAKISSLKKEIIDEEERWYIQVNNISKQKINDYISNLKSFNFIFENDVILDNNQVEEQHINNEVNVYLKYNPKSIFTNLLLTVVLE